MKDLKDALFKWSAKIAIIYNHKNLITCKHNKSHVQQRPIFNPKRIC